MDRSTFEAAANGVHVRGTPIWCDVARAGGVCFVSRADVKLGRGKAHRVVASERTATLRAQMGAAFVDPLLPRMGRPFALGKLRLELLPSGRGEGAAQLLVQSGDGPGTWRGLYAGSVWPDGAQVRECDELVIDAPDEGVRDDEQAIDAALTGGGEVFVEDLDVLAWLRARYGARVRVSGAWRKLSPKGKVLEPAIVASPNRGLRIIAGRRPASAEHCLALGLGPSAASWLAWVRQTSAKRVHIRAAPGDEVHGLVRMLAQGGVTAELSHPPMQLSLFGRTRFTVARDDS